jgi:murein DD-endopeptidase MepM/ murein hydrolase activator NlpD
MSASVFVTEATATMITGAPHQPACNSILCSPGIDIFQDAFGRESAGTSPIEQGPSISRWLKNQSLTTSEIPRPYPEKATERTTMLSHIPNGSPLKHAKPSSTFGSRLHPTQKKSKPHTGIDFSTAPGTSVFSTAGGVIQVADSSNTSPFGNYIVIDHGMGFTTLYAHLQKLNFRPGDVVAKGAEIARSGNTGRSTGPHLHYEVQYNKNPLNPKHFTEWTPDNYEAIFSQVTVVPWTALRRQSGQPQTVARWTTAPKVSL